MKKLLLSLSLLAALAGCADKSQNPVPAVPTAVAARANATHLPAGRQTELYADQYMLPGDKLRDASGSYAFYLQGDGNMVVYNTYRDGTIRSAVAATGTEGRRGDLLIMQNDGNLVLYNTTTGEAVWYSDTFIPGSYIEVVGGRLRLRGPGGIRILF